LSLATQGSLLWKLDREVPRPTSRGLHPTAQEHEFLSWWLETEYGQQLTKNGQYKFRWSTESRSSEVWRHFDQVAELRSGRPKVVCRSCLTPLNHPHHPHHKSHGTSAMGKHLKSNSCRRSKQKVSVSAVTPGAIQEDRAGFPPERSRFTKAQLKEQLLRTITSANLPFGLTEEPTFRELLKLVYAGPQVLELPSVDENLVLSLQEKLISSGGISRLQCFVGLPGTVQAIQLCLRRYIENITSSPERERVENVRAISHANGWTEPSGGEEIMFIRSFAKFVNETRGKRDEFLCLQPPGIRLLPLDDANARWNSVFLMLKRASRLRRFIDQYCQERGNLRYKLTNMDWRKVDYVLQLTMPFIQFTTALLASKEATSVSCSRY
ncbi:hypothetical protein N7485_005593, partial [Penicillium canescens]